jgi:hypothetical protein
MLRVACVQSNVLDWQASRTVVFEKAVIDTCFQIVCRSVSFICAIIRLLSRTCLRNVL